MSDDAFDAGKPVPELTFDAVDLVVHIVDGHRRVDAAVEIHDLAVRGVTHPHVVDLTDKCDVGDDGGQRGAHFGGTLNRRIASGQSTRLQRLDVRLDFDLGAEL